MMDAETELLAGLIELQYGQKVEEKLRRVAAKVPWAKGWPTDTTAFWNAEAFMWSRKIEKETRDLIKDELKFLAGGKNLDVGCGAYSYIPSVGFDLSPKMLDFNDNCNEKVQGDLEKKLPFADGSFDSVTAIFVLNYVQKYEQLLSEVKRVLRSKGTLVMVLSGIGIHDWQRQKEVNNFEGKKWKGLLETEGFTVRLYRKGGLLFLKGEC